MADALADDNGNGAVDAADYAEWRDTMNQMGTALAADGNGNHEIDAGDYDGWRVHFGQTAGSAAGSMIDAANSAAVPEPTSILVALLAFCSWLLPQRWR